MKQDGSAKARPVFRWVVRTGSVLFYTLLGVGVVWLAAARWNGVPADPVGGAMRGAFGASVPIDPALDRTQALGAALAAIPPMPRLTLPAAPPGMKWLGRANIPIDVDDALSGAWTPETRPILQGVIAYLETPGVTAALSQIASFEPGGWRPFGPNAPGIGLASVREAAKMFVARARYHHAGRSDVDAALADLASTYRLSSTVFDSGQLIGPLVAIACIDLANVELRRVAREHDLTPAQVADIRGVLRTYGLDRQQMWQNLTDAATEDLHRTVDRCWTDDGEGNGWLVLSRLDHVTPANRARKPRCGAWNLLSPLFNDRRTVLGKITRLHESQSKAAQLPYEKAVAFFEATEGTGVFGLPDGPLSLAFLSRSPNTHETVVRTVTSSNATIVTVALSAYRHDHGEYPASLDELVDEYLDRMPLDPYVDEPLHYRRDGEGFVLYSVGSNQVDDGGREATLATTGTQARWEGDLIYTEPRREPYFEPTLVDVQP
ncbi:MAG TPA: hypothetical protein VM243_21595 [Phycisphaerae bacterium]|nr:hypothetical protein [Phycisphaerae bacterium]